MVKLKFYRGGGITPSLIFLLSLFVSCNNEPQIEPIVKSSNAKVKSIIINSQSFDFEKEEETQEFYVDEDAEEKDLISQIEVVFEDAKADKEVVPENEEPFLNIPHAEKKYTINTFAENGKKGKSYSVKLIRFIIDKTIEIKAPPAPFNSGLDFSFKPDFMVLGNGRTLDFDTYSIGKYEVTYKLWKTIYDFAKKEGYTFNWIAPTTEIKKEDLLKPITNINWLDALIWCNAFSAYKKSKGFSPLYVKKGTEEVLKDATNINDCMDCEILLNKIGVRLPTELEWEVAARGGLHTKPEWAYDFSGTNEVSNLGEYAWFEDNSQGKTNQVGTKKPNSIGIYDMVGNAGEYCFDFADTSKPFLQGETVINPIGFKAGGMPLRIEKGASFLKQAKYLKIANRNRINLTLEVEDDGFRFVVAKNTRPFTYEEPAPKLEVDEIIVGSRTFTKAELTSLTGATIQVSTSPATIIVKFAKASEKAKLIINKLTPVSFTNGQASINVEVTNRNNPIDLEVTDFGKQSAVWSFVIENTSVGGVTPPPPPPPPPGPPGPPPPPSP